GGARPPFAPGASCYAPRVPLSLRRLALGAAPALVIVALAYLGARRALHPPAGPAAAGSPAAPLPPVTAGVTPAPPAPGGSAELGLLSPREPGGTLAGFTVREIRGVERGRLRVVCAQDRAVVRLEVALADPEGTLPPATAGRYAVFYALDGATPED